MERELEKREGDSRVEDFKKELRLVRTCSSGMIGEIEMMC